MRIHAALCTLFALFMLGCPEHGGPDCIDLDGDSYGDFCLAGDDCDDNDVDNWDSCTACVDGDTDGSFVGCDAFTTRSGPDCNDADVDNQTACSACVDADADGSFVGCEAYTTRSGPDCNDADGDNQTSCSTCLDGDGDGDFVGCDLYVSRSGPDCDDANADAFGGAAPSDSTTACMLDADGDDRGDSGVSGAITAGTDCDDADPNNWASCSSCVDNDGDLAFVGCDAYTSLAGPDCDDANPDRSPIEPELADDGLDNDCSGQDLVAVHASTGVFVDEMNAACSDVAAVGTRAIPWCSLEPALTAAASGNDVFVAEGSYTLTDLVLWNGGVLRVHGGYDSGSFTRDVMSNTTTVDLGGSSNQGLQFSGSGILLDALDFVSLTSGAGRVLDAFARSVSVTRSTFQYDDGNAWMVSGVGGSTPEGDFLFRDNTSDWTGTALGPFVASALYYERVRIENNQASTQSFNAGLFYTGGLAATPNVDEIYFLNNSIYGASRVTALRGHANDVNVIIGNSIQSDETVATRTFFEVSGDEMTILNNGIRTPSSSRGFAIGDVARPLPTVLDITNNVLLNGSGAIAASITAAGQGTTLFNSAGAINLQCTDCTTSVGNLDADMNWVNPANGDFSLQTGSPGIDGGIDPTGLIDYFRASLDQDGTVRPLDGDGVGGPAHDVGAIEH